MRLHPVWQALLASQDFRSGSVPLAMQIRHIPIFSFQRYCKSIADALAISKRLYPPRAACLVPVLGSCGAPSSLCSSDPSFHPGKERGAHKTSKALLLACLVHPRKLTGRLVNGHSCLSVLSMP